MRKKIKIKIENTDRKLFNFINEIKKEYNIFFDFNIIDPLLFIVNSRKDFDLIVGKKTDSWLVAITKGNNIYILDKEKFSTESTHKKEEFWQTLAHEYSHIYYTQITKSHYPYWLNEGLAEYLSKKKLLLDKEEENKLLDVVSHFDKSNIHTYKIGYFWVEKLIKKYGHKKIIQLIKSLDIEEELSNKIFTNKFYRIYSIYFNKKSLKEILE